MRQVLITQNFRFGSQATFASNSNFGKMLVGGNKRKFSNFGLNLVIASTANNSNFFGVSAGYKATRK
jgi:hypothetical protein